MLPANPGGHAAYQDTFVSDLLKFYPDPFVLSKSTWDYIVLFWYLDLSQTDSIMQECYSVFGPQPRLPSCMMRSYLLALKLKVTSITDWCRMLRETPLYALLSGFPFGDTPGVGTFYDFFSRIWNDATNNLSPKDRFPKRKTPKGKKKGDKTPAWLPIFFLYSNAGSSNRIILFPSSSVFISSSSWTFPSVRGWSTRNIWLLPATVLLYAALLNSEKSGSVNVRNSAPLPAAVNAIIPNLTATGGGTPTGNAISLVTTSTCMWLPIHTVTFPFFLFWSAPPGMTCFLFSIPFSP